MTAKCINKHLTSRDSIRSRDVNHVLDFLELAAAVGSTFSTFERSCKKSISTFWSLGQLWEAYFRLLGH